VRILGISGSLSAASSNTALLRAVAEVAPAGVEVVLYEGLGGLPHFNPDLDRDLDDPRLPAAVRELRARVGEADALLISSPEYAHGVPGSLKNALDWLVGASEMPGKPVALVNASPHAVHAQASLAETLRTMSAAVVPGSPFPVRLAGRGRRLEEVADSSEIREDLRAVLAALVAVGGG
jgi:NAD(P)H-dependent FMN reductase